MISSGWRENRKKINRKNICITKQEYKDEERKSFLEKTILEFIRRSKYKARINEYSDEDNISIYKFISIDKCTNYDFIECNIYIEGIDGLLDISRFDNKQAIRNCRFKSCTLISCYENSIQFRYCELYSCIYECQIEQLDFSQCFIDILSIYPTDDDNKTINDELSINAHSDIRAMTKLNKVKVYGKVYWVLLYDSSKIIIDEMVFINKHTTDIACYDNEEFISNLIKDHKIIIYNNNYTIH